MSTEKLARAHTLLNQGDHAQAETLYREILAVQPNLASALFGLGQVAMACDRPTAAAELLQKALQAEPDNPEYWLALAKALTLAGYPDDAGKVLAEGQNAGVLAKDSPAPDALPAYALEEIARAQKALEKQQHHRANQIAKELAQKWPNSFEIQNLLGRIKAQQGQYREALEPLYKAHQLAPDNWRLLLDLGQCLHRLRQLGDARQCLERVLEQQPDQPVALLHLSSVMNHLGKAQQALELADKGLNSKPDEAQFWLCKGNAYRTLKQADEARHAYQKALELRPNYAQAITNLGNLANDQGRHQEAAEHYRHALKLLPDHPETLHNLGAAYFEMGLPDEALSSYEKAAALDPRKIETIEAIGGLRAWTDPDDPKLLALRSALDAGHLPLDQQMHAGFALAKALYDLKQFDEAFEVYEAANQAALQFHGPWKINVRAALFNEFQKVAKKGLLRPPADHGLADQCEVFILGFSRSGKSLIEGLLTADPAIQAARETRDFITRSSTHIGELSAIEHTNPILHYLKALDSATSRADARRYLDEVNPARQLRTLTNPDNLPVLGFLAHWLPKTPIIFCRRQLLDLGLACYFKRYARGNEYSYRLDTLGQEIRIYDAFIDLWKAHLPNPMLEVQYEELVADPESVAKQIYAFLGREWKPEYMASLDQNAALVEAISPAGSIEAPSAIRDDFVGFSEPFRDRLDDLIKGYESVTIKND